MIDFSVYAEQVYARCDELAQLSQSDEFLDRRYLTTQHMAANQQVAQWCKQAGMNTWQDQAGNQWGSYSSDNRDAPTFILGSHLDTVPNGGKYDGMLGVLIPISLIQYFHDNGIKFPFNIDIVGFGDEEGTRFGSTLLGSQAVVGQWDDKWASLMDADKKCLGQAMREAGLDINQVHRASRERDNILGFVEVHIEQGPVLESENLAVGVVSGIAGARRFTLDVKGVAGHAGTVPMSMRRDAVNAASEVALLIESIALKQGVVATVGKINTVPGAVNVIASKVQLSLDIRSEDNLARDTAIELIMSQVKDIEGRRNVSVGWTETHNADAVICDENLKNKLMLASEEVHQKAFELPSGAGHDAMAMSALWPVAMLFVRCEKGISHHPAEAITEADIGVTLDVLCQFLVNYRSFLKD
jgi:allantoate deiminase